jgi:Ser/Thr protein kinase RdoA (MazF antagonist)
METHIFPEHSTLIGRGRTAEIFAWDEGRALKLYYPGWPADEVEHEAAVSQVVAATGVAAPVVDGVLVVEGRQGILFERLIGQSLLHQVAAKPWTLGRAVRAFTDLHLTIHTRQVTGADLPALVERLARQIQDAPLVSARVRTAALRQLEQQPEGNALCHGDYHPDNVLVTARGLVIIDWGSASRGHTLADVAQTELLLQIGEPPGSPSGIERALLAMARTYVRRAYVRRYLRRRPARLQELAAWRLPVAVARLAEEVPGERNKLQQIIDTAMVVA